MRVTLSTSRPMDSSSWATAHAVKPPWQKPASRKLPSGQAASNSARYDRAISSSVPLASVDQVEWQWSSPVRSPSWTRAGRSPFRDAAILIVDDERSMVRLLEQLLAHGQTVLLETGGHISVDRVPERVFRVIDVKCPGSGESERNYWANLDDLRPTDEIKFVIKDRTDYEYARDVVVKHGLTAKVAAVLFSPVHGVLDPKTLSAWILEDHLDVRLQLQLHKYIWSPETRGV